jgi:hypothetical protein
VDKLLGAWKANLAYVPETTSWYKQYAECVEDLELTLRPPKALARADPPPEPESDSRLLQRIADCLRETDGLQNNWLCGDCLERIRAWDVRNPDPKDWQAEARELRAMLQELLECPYTLDSASIPAAGIEAAPKQVVGTLSVAWLRFEKAKALLRRP